jgi:hypothetical protein
MSVTYVCFGAIHFINDPVSFRVAVARQESFLTNRNRNLTNPNPIESLKVDRSCIHSSARCIPDMGRSRGRQVALSRTERFTN